MPRASTDDVRSARRVLCYGVTGSGKSTAARAWAAAIDAPLVLMDELLWRPGWQQVPREEQPGLVAPLVAADCWVMDTMYGAGLHLALGRADLIVALDYPRWFSLQRLIRRTVRRIVTREPVCNGNVETWRRALDKDSIIAWHFRSFTAKRRRMRLWADASSGPPVLLLTSPRELGPYLAGLRA